MSYMYGCGQMGYYLTYKSYVTPTYSWSSIYLYSLLGSAGGNFYGMWGVSASEVYAAGDDGVILKCKGGTCSSSTYWTKETSGTTNHLRDLWGFSSTSVYAVGYTGTVLKYDGASWTSMGPKTDTYLYGVWGTSPSDLWVVGHPYFKPDESIWHYNGTKWTKVPPPRTSYLNAVWGASASEVWAVGNFNILKLRKAP